MYTNAETLLRNEIHALKHNNHKLKLENEVLRTELRSLKTKYNEPTAKRPVYELPKEIWWLVFQRVMPPTHLLDSFLSAGPDSPWSRTLEMKKNLTLVCQAWYEVGTSFLYRDVTIRRFPQLVSLLRTLEGPSGQELGKLIKSLEVNCFIPGGSIAVKFGRCLRTIFSLCSSLTRFSYSSQCALPPAVFQYNDPFPASITELSLDKSVDSATLQRILDYVRKSLQYLRFVTPIADWPSPYQSGQTSSTFPSLHTLWLEICGWRWGPEINAMATWTLPSLNRLIVTRVAQVQGSYFEGDSNTLSTNVAKDITLSLIMRCGGTIKYLCLHKPPYSREFLQQLLDWCPSLERITVDFRHPDDDKAAAYHLGPHSSLRCVDFLIASLDEDAHIEVEGIPSFLGYREFFGLPPFAYHWLHDFDATTEAEMNDSFEVNLFQHRVAKCAARIRWDVAASTPRLQDPSDESSSSEASADEVLYDIFTSSSDDDVAENPEGSVFSETAEGSTFSEASKGSARRDVLMSDGSVADLLLDDVVGRKLDAECDIFDTFCSNCGFPVA